MINENSRFIVPIVGTAICEDLCACLNSSRRLTAKQNMNPSYGSHENNLREPL